MKGIGSIAASTLAVLAFAQQPQRSFEVASVKLGDPNDHRYSVRSLPGGRVSATKVSLRALIGIYYDVRDFQITGGPSWLGSERFNVEAHADSASFPPPGPAARSQLALMVQSLLADRFKLVVHRETRKGQVYELAAAKGSPKLKEVAETQQGVLTIGRGRWTSNAAPLGILAANLSQLLERPVIDKTGLTGFYDFTLTYTPEPGQGGAGPLPGPDAPPIDPNGPSLFTALQEQLGLRLAPAKGPIEMLVVDRAEKPSEN